MPFCARRCSYCDFSIAVRRTVPVGEYIDALARELALRTSRGERWQVDTLYLGGGTPSLLGAHGVLRVLEVLRSHFDLAPDAEVTLEANPDDVTASAITAWRAGGINRLSLGSQSFDDRVLGWMHRTHVAGQIGRAVELAREGGIADFSLDLIFALPAALGRDWASDLELAVALEPTHLSVYGLTVEPATPLGRWRDRGEAIEAPEEEYESEFLAAHAALSAAGFDHYEVSSYAARGRRARHNSAYWRRVPYEGFGPSAHAFDGQVRRWNVAPYAEWVRRLQGGNDPLGGSERLSESDVLAEQVYLGLRTTEGLPTPLVSPAQLDLWQAAGWASVRGETLALTPDGWLRLDALAAGLTLIGSHY